MAGLLFLVGFRRRLIGTISAFTLAHSLTLACSVFGWITLRSAPVEASIAMSIVLVASEALRERDTLARRVPALVSFLFGLVHGLGFAGALKDIGLPQSHLPLALLTFNVGVEIGQLLMVLAAFMIVRLPVPQRWLGGARRPALYVIGVVAAYWSWLAHRRHRVLTRRVAAVNRLAGIALVVGSILGMTGRAGAADFNVTNSGMSAFVINTQSNPGLTLTRGHTYTFDVNALGHPFWLKTVRETGTSNTFDTGVTNNGITVGTLTFSVPANAPSPLYYQCQFHDPMAGVLTIVSPAAPTTTKLTLVAGGLGLAVLAFALLGRARPAGAREPTGGSARTCRNRPDRRSAFRP